MGGGATAAGALKSKEINMLGLDLRCSGLTFLQRGRFTALKQISFHRRALVFNRSVKNDVEKLRVARKNAEKMRGFTLCTTTGANINNR